MESPFTQLMPELFPIGSLYLVAPFWADVDIQGGVGDISYQVYAIGSPLLDMSLPSSVMRLCWPLDTSS